MKCKTKIIAHRGFTEKYPENTLLAFQKAIEYGADGIELDVQPSKDKKIIVHHDYYLGHTDNGHGAIFQKASSYLKSLNAGSWFNKKFSAEQIPTLEDVFEKFGDGTRYEIELKWFTGQFLREVLVKVEKYGLFGRIEFTSHSLPLLRYLKQIQSRAITGMFVEMYPEWMSLDLGHELTKSNLLLGKINIAHCPPSILTKKFIKDLRRLKIKVHASNCDSKNDLMKMYKLGVDQLSTNKLRLAIAMRN